MVNLTREHCVVICMFKTLCNKNRGLKSMCEGMCVCAINEHNRNQYKHCYNKCGQLYKSFFFSYILLYFIKRHKNK